MNDTMIEAMETAISSPPLKGGTMRSGVSTSSQTESEG
jgi:hypothetical protein